MANAALVKVRIRAFMIGISQRTGAGANPALAFRRLCAFFPVISVIANIERAAVVISAISVQAVAEIHLFSCRSFRTTGLAGTHRSEACRTLILNQIGSEAYSGRRAVVASGVAGRSVVFVITVILSYLCIATCIDCTTRRTTGRVGVRAVRSRRTRRAGVAVHIRSRFACSSGRMARRRGRRPRGIGRLSRRTRRA